MVFPLSFAVQMKFTLSGADKRLDISPVATGDRGAASGHRKLFEKSLIKNFHRSLIFQLCCFLFDTFSFPKEFEKA